MDHQSVGLIARKIEEAGIPTTYIGSCRDIMISVKAPRSAFVNFPLGRQCGKPNTPALQKKILLDGLSLLTTAKTPGELVDLDYDWGQPFGWPDFLNSLKEMLEEEEGQSPF